MEESGALTDSLLGGHSEAAEGSPGQMSGASDVVPSVELHSFDSAVMVEEESAAYWRTTGAEEGDVGSAGLADGLGGVDVKKSRRKKSTVKRSEFLKDIKIEHKYEQAACYVNDARSGRAINHRLDSFSLKVYNLHNRWIVQLLSLAFFEEPTNISNLGSERVTAAIEFLLLHVFVVELLLKGRFLGLKQMAHDSWSICELLAIISEPKTRYALKKIIVDEGNLKRAMREGEIQQQLLHPHIVRIFGSFAMKNPEVSNEFWVFLVLELCEGDLFDDLNAHIEAKEYYEESRLLEWTAQICSVLDYLHSGRYSVQGQTGHLIYRDLKPENLFFQSLPDEKSADGTKKPHRILKLGDFGVTRISSHASMTRTGTEMYLAPEIVEQNSRTVLLGGGSGSGSAGAQWSYGAHYDEKVDCFSLGAMLFYMAALEAHTNLSKEAGERTYSPQKFRWMLEKDRRYSPEFVNLVLSLVECESKKRPNAREILDSPLLAPYVELLRRIEEPVLSAVRRAEASVTSAFAREEAEKQPQPAETDKGPPLPLRGSEQEQPQPAETDKGPPVPPRGSEQEQPQPSEVQPSHASEIEVEELKKKVDPTASLPMEPESPDGLSGFAQLRISCGGSSSSGGGSSSRKRAAAALISSPPQSRGAAAAVLPPGSTGTPGGTQRKNTGLTSVQIRTGTYTREWLSPRPTGRLATTTGAAAAAGGGGVGTGGTYFGGGKALSAVVIRSKKGNRFGISLSRKLEKVAGAPTSERLEMEFRDIVALRFSPGEGEDSVLKILCTHTPELVRTTNRKQAVVEKSVRVCDAANLGGDAVGEACETTVNFPPGQLFAFLVEVRRVCDAERSEIDPEEREHALAMIADVERELHPGLPSAAVSGVDVERSKL